MGSVKVSYQLPAQAADRFDNLCAKQDGFASC
jgi:hypothetical protein